MQFRFLLTGLAFLAACSLPPSTYTSQVNQWAEFEIGFLSPPKEVSVATDDSFEALFQEARFKNQELLASWQKWRATIELIPQAAGLPDPKLQAGIFLSSLETKSGSANSRLSLQQAFPWPGTLNCATRVASAKAEAARQDYLSKELQLRAKMRKLCAEHFWLTSSLNSTKAHLDILTQMETVVRKRWEEGVAEHGSLIKLQMELAILEEKAAAIHDQQQPLLAEINSLLNRSPLNPLNWPKDALLLPTDLDSNQLMRNLEFNNPQMRGWDCLEQAHQMKVHLAELGMFPNFTIGIDWTGIESNGIGNDSGKDAFALGVGLELPLQQRSRKSRVRQSRSMLASIRAQRIQTLSTLLSELETEFFKLRDAERRFELHQNGLVPKGQQALDSTLIAYQSGKASFLDYLDTQRTLLDSELAVLRATADRSITLAEIAALSGTQLSER